MDLILEDMTSEVTTWASNTEKEINTLKSLEDYRKNYLGNVAHELKTPIFTIQGYLHTLAEGGLYDPTINKAYLSKAISNLNRLESIISDLDVITELEHENIDLKIKSFDIKDLINESIEDLESIALKVNNTISFDYSQSLSYLVKADRSKLRQVVDNLLTNAIHYGSENGRTSINIYDLENNKLLVEIADDGSGIEEVHLKHVFDRFYRADPSRSRSLGGSGLGLAIVKHIIEAHNETINLRSTLDLGSTFGFTIEKA